MATTKKTIKKAPAATKKESPFSLAAILSALEQYFGFKAFKGTQEKVI